MLTDFVPDYLLIGHIAHDVTPQGPQLGGTVSYAAHTAVAFGLRVGILTSAAANEPLLAKLPSEAKVISVPAEHTTTFENLYGADGQRTQYMYHRAVPLKVEMLPSAWRHARLIHLGPIADEVDPAFVTAFGNRPICVTPQGWMRKRESDGRVTAIPWKTAEHVLSRAALTVLSKEDIRHNPDLEAVYCQMSPRFLVTDGMHGGIVYERGQPRRYAAQMFEQIDPTGAGDVFATVLHIALDRLRDMERALLVAARLAGQSVGRVGFASAPTPEEIAQAWAMYTDHVS
jgi:sugar/nucleoside kinase (ribokinase family)